MSRMRTGSEAASDAPTPRGDAYNRHAYDLNWSGVLRFTAPTLGLAAVLGTLMAITLGTGCTSKNPNLTESTTNLSASDAPRASALDVGPVPAGSTAAAAPAYTPPAAAPTNAPPTQAAYVPTASAPPEPLTTQTPSQIASTGANVGLSGAGSTTYTVQKGDTLFRIAKDHYGDGKQWKRITAANPGLTPANLKVGQKIVIP